MALAMMKIKVGKKGNATAHAEYIARQGKYENYNKTEKLESTGYGNMPAWAEHKPNYFWAMADEHERKNGSTYREHIIALPRELTQEQRLNLVNEWIEQEVGTYHAYQYAIHSPEGMDGKEQPHLHLMINERTQDGIERDPEQYFKRYNSRNPDKGGAKKANTGIKPAERKEQIKELRRRWELKCNKHLERAGIKARIDMSKQELSKETRHIPYEQIKRPEVEKAYREELKARQEQHQHLVNYAKIGNPYDDLNLARQDAERREQAPQQTPPEPKPQDKQTEKTELSISDKYELMKEFDNQMLSDAETLLNERLQAIRDDAKPRLAEIERLRDNKPLKPWKWKEWQQDIDRRVAEYEKIKETHDRLKAQGVTDADKQTAMKNYYLANPQDYERIVEINRELKEHERQQEQQTQQQERVSVTRSRDNSRGLS